MDPQSFQKLILETFKNRNHSGYIDHQQVRLIDQILLFFKLEVLIFRWRWQLLMKSTMKKQKYWMNLLFVVFRSFFFIACLPWWVNWFTVNIHVNVSLNYSLSKLRLYTCMHTNNCVCVFMLYMWSIIL